MKKMSKYALERMQFKNKPRKVLSLEERIQALRMFDQTPIYQRVATAFGCSWEQIKNVVLSREEILTYYARCQTIMPNEHPKQIRKKKIIFLGNVVFEYIRRAFYHNSASLEEEAIRTCALKFRDAIQIEQFYPNSAWLNDFKRVFNVDLPNPENIIVTQAQPPPDSSLACEDIIAYCRNEIDQILAGKNKRTKSIHENNGSVSSTSFHNEDDNTDEEDNKIANVNDHDHDDGNDIDSGNRNGSGNGNREDVCDNYDDDTAAEDEEGLTIDFSHYEYNDITTISTNSQSKVVKRSPSSAVDSSSMWSKKIKQERHDSNSPSIPTPPPTTVSKSIQSKYVTTIIPPQILSSKSALTHLIPLQDYALGEEDFVAINLLASLVEHYQRDVKKSEKK